MDIKMKKGRRSQIRAIIIVVIFLIAFSSLFIICVSQFMKKSSLPSSISTNELAEGNLSQNSVLEDTQLEDRQLDDSVSENRISGSIVSENGILGDTASESILSKDEELQTQTLKQQKIENMMEQMTIEEKVAQMFIITPEALTKVQTVQSAGETTKQAIQKYPVGGLVYFSSNIASKEQVIAMLKTTQEYSLEITGLPMFLAVDEEGGSVARIANSGVISVEKTPDMAEIGATMDEKKAYETGQFIGGYLEELGFNLDFAPVADVLTNPENEVVKKRSFGTDGNVVALMDLSMLAGLSECNVYGTLKHFPGHGGTEADSHEGYAYTEKTLEQLKEAELIPFREGVKNEVPFIMIGHISTPNITGDNSPASLSKKITTDLLRKEMGYKGIIITDAMNMGAITTDYNSGEAAVKAISAGSDIVLMPKDFNEAYERVCAAVKSGELSEAQINESVERILSKKMDLMEIF